MPKTNADQTSLQLVISKQAKSALIRFARDNNMSASELVRVAVQQYLDNRHADIDVTEGVGTWGTNTRKQGNS